MTKIKLNETEFEIDQYNRSTYLADGTIHSNGSFNVVTTEVSLDNLMGVPINSIQITHNSNVIYELNDINAHIDSISEFLSGDHIGVSVSLTFDIE